MPDRRSFLADSAALLTLPEGASGETAEPVDGRPQWIWYPGQLAAYRMKRRLRLAVERCVHVGYPANFRQPAAKVLFRRKGMAQRDIPLRWSAPLGRVHLTVNGKGGDITDHAMVWRSGSRDIAVQIDFADTMPCLWLSGAEFSSGPDWEASLDGEDWRPVETGGWTDPGLLPNAAREIVTPLPVRALIPPSQNPGFCRLAKGEPLVADFRETELGSLHLTVRGQGTLRIAVGESLPEVQDDKEKHFEQKPLPAILLGDQPRAIALPERALRYARFTTDGMAEIQGLRFDAQITAATQTSSPTTARPRRPSPITGS